jgi:predicted ATPase
MLGTSRLLTLTGHGGIGKTRLALRVATEALASYPDGVWLVRREALADPHLVAKATASVLGVRERPGQRLLDTLTQAIRA